MAKKTKTSGSDAFDAFYTAQFAQRWPALKAALLQTHPYTELSEGLTHSYFLDTASALAIQAMDIKAGMSVLDMCAAPGGKSLLIALEIGESGQLTLNERSLDRFHRLKRTMTLLKSRPKEIVFTRCDARRYAMQYPDKKFMRVLLDAPCSSEAHVLKSPKHLNQWTAHRPKRLAIEQVAMLCQALQLCEQGGKIVYSTCSINSQENDGVIAKLLKKRPDIFMVENLTLSFGQKTEYGWQVWPDIHNQGPLYIASLICKKNESSPRKKL